jgi:adenylate cyclase
MPAPAAPDTFLFDGFRLCRRGGGLFRRMADGSEAPVALGSRALDILALLVERHGDLVTKSEIHAAVWPGTIVEDSNLPVQIAALRRVLDEDRAQGSCIQTIAGRGYRFVAPVTRRKADGPAPPAGREAARPIPLPARTRLGRGAVRLVGVGVVVAMGIAAVLWWPWGSSGLLSPMPAAVSVAPPGIIATKSARRLSIVVLPFANLSNDPEQEYFADGITDDLTTDLSRLADSFVIARATAFTFKGRPSDAKQIGRELGVRYALEGSVQRFANRLRVNAQLIDTETGAHLWAERFDRDTGDLFALQNEITGRIAVALDMELVAAEAARPVGNADALDYILRGRAAMMKPPSPARYPDAIRLFERAVELDPHSVEAQSRLAINLMARAVGGMSDSPAPDIARAETLADKALAAAPRNPLAHQAKAQVLRAQHRCEQAIPEYEAVLASNRNFLGVGLVACKLDVGSLDEVIPLAERGIRLSPRDPEIGVLYLQIGRVHLLQSRTAEAILWFEKARSAMPDHFLTHSALASAYALNGEAERAAAELAEARRLVKDDRYSSLARLRTFGSSAPPPVRALWEATYMAGLHKAGMPEE